MPNNANNLCEAINAANESELTDSTRALTSKACKIAFTTIDKPTHDMLIICGFSIETYLYNKKVEWNHSIDALIQVVKDTLADEYSDKVRITIFQTETPNTLMVNVAKYIIVQSSQPYPTA